MVPTLKAVYKRKYGYGIVDRQGNVFWDESCVCADRGPLLEQVQNMNYDEAAGAPFRVVKLFWQSSARRSSKEA